MMNDDEGREIVRVFGFLFGLIGLIFLFHLLPLKEIGMLVHTS